jgi:uncharacterized protein (TIGR02246 family)
MKLILLITAVSIVAAGLAVGQDAKQDAALEQEIRKLDLAEAKAILQKDFQALDTLCAEDFTVNNPRGEISKGREAVKELIRSGVVNYASFVREIETVLIHENTVIVMGRETIVSAANTPQAGQAVRRRYTNIWMKRKGKWLLTARHANVIRQG